MKYLIQLFVFLALLASVNYAQTVYVSSSVTESNEPINAKNHWEIEAWGKNLHVILDTENQTIKGNIVYLFIDKFIDGEYSAFDSKSVNIQQGVRRIKYDYNFSEVGKYKLYYINVAQEKLASVVITVTEKASKKNRVVKRSNYYDNVKLIFCEKVLVGGTPIGVKKRASLSENNGQIFIKLTNFSPLKTEIILVDFWRKEHRSFEYDEYVESKKYRVSPDWADTYFKYRFLKAGEYKIVIYNQAEVLISTGYINVLN